jgi:hypothetical protein
MAKNSMSSLGKIFEERAKQIDADRRAAKETTLPDAKVENEPIRMRVIEAEGRPAYIVEMQGNTLRRSMAADSPEGQEILQAAPATPVFTLPSPAPTPPETQTETERALSSTQEVAAVSGRVAPNDLLATNLPDEVRQAVLNGLAAECTVETYQGTVRWLLSPAARNTALRRLIDSNRLTHVLDGPLPPTDSFGDVLRMLLREGANLNLEQLDREQLQNLIAAMEATNESGLSQPSLFDVRQRLVRKEFLSEYDVLLARGFVGRKQELAKLYEFLSSGNDPSHAATWTSLVLTGLGGSGKSTLLAKFARDVAKDKLATVVILDFDRPGIDARDFYWMEQEISRQVGHQYPGSSEFLRSRRSEERRHRGEYRDSVRQSSADVSEEARSSRSIIFDVANVLTSENATDRPFLLVLDTYEQIEDQDLSAAVFDWLYDLSSYLQIKTALKVIFSGRLYDSNLQLLQQQSQSTTVEVKELDPEDAQQLLLQNGIPAPTAKRLVRSGVLPLRPLELTLLARITIDLEKTIDELENEINEGGDAARQLFAGLVYRRVLRRLQDPTAQRLAYPGLVLRYVTVELIRDVLGPALDMPPFDDAGAKQAFDALASANWLVSLDGDKVWHRSDLRRSTLKAMLSAERDNAKKISDHAIKYFEAKSDVASQAEAVYHRLLWVDDPEEGDRFQLAELKRANDHIKANIGDLPAVAATLLKFAVEGKVPSIELESLPKRYIDSGYSAAGKELVTNRQFGKALKLHDRRHHGMALEPAAILEDWEVDALFSTATWDRLIFEEPKIKNQPRESLLFAISRALYPLQIVSPELLKNFALGHLLEAATQDEKILYGALRLVDGQETLRRLVMSMIYAIARGENDAELRTVIERLARYRESSGNSPIVPVTERRLVLLNRSLSLEKSSDVPLAINTLQLSEGWVRSFREYLTRNRDDADNANELLGLLSDLTSALTEFNETATIRTVLAKVDSIAKDEGVKRGTTLKVHQHNTSAVEAWSYLRGPSPEFRDPCRFALLEAFPDRSALRKLGEIVASLIYLKTPDLKPDAFADIITANPEQALAPYIEFVDRCWALGDLMRHAVSLNPAPKLQKVSEALTRWEEALSATIYRGLTPGSQQISHPN